MHEANEGYPMWSEPTEGLLWHKSHNFNYEKFFLKNGSIWSWMIYWVWFTGRWSFIPSSSPWSWLNIAGRRILFLKATVLWPKVKPSLTQQSRSSPINTAAARHKYASAGVFRYSLLFKRWSSTAVYRDHAKCSILTSSTPTHVVPNP